VIVVELRAEIETFLEVGLPEVSSPPTGKYPRHARPPKAMRIASFLSRG
jgi:hypothetical protein